MNSRVYEKKERKSKEINNKRSTTREKFRKKVRNNLQWERVYGKETWKRNINGQDREREGGVDTSIFKN